jgi:hypothetical protein
VTIPLALAADLALLTEALDLPGTDIATTMAALASDAATAVTSYVGLTVRLGTGDTGAVLTTLDDDSAGALITTSLRIPLGRGTWPARGEGTAIVLILYAAAPGAFVDLAADLAWLTGVAIDEMHLDDDLPGGVRRPMRSLRTESTINEAVGVLMNGGSTLDQARADLDARAAADGVPLHSAALAVLDSLPQAASHEGDRHLPGR